MEASTPVDLTIIICAYNAENRIGTTLKYLKEVKSEYLWHVVIVDNNSSDNTAKLVSEFIRDNHINNISLLKEPRQGKTFAWETGLSHSSSRYVMICDDDNWLPIDFVTRAVSFMDAHPAYQVMGIQTTPEFEIEPPSWFDRFSGSYAVGHQYSFSGEVTNEYNKLWGAGTIILREAIQFLYDHGFKHIFRGTKDQGMGEDHELFFALRLAGKRLYYNDNICVVHFVARQRLNWEYPMNIYRKAARNSCLFDPYEKADLNFGNGIRGYIKKTAFYEVYVSLRNIIKMKPSLFHLIKSPGPEADQQWFNCYFQRQRIIGLFVNSMRYPSLLKMVRTAKWRKTA